jgi:hypothetical protein
MSIGRDQFGSGFVGIQANSKSHMMDNHRHPSVSKSASVILFTSGREIRGVSADRSKARAGA